MGLFEKLHRRCASRRRVRGDDDGDARRNRRRGRRGAGGGSGGSDERRRRMLAATLTAMGMMAVMMTMIPAGDVASAASNGPVGTGSVGACRAALSWPLETPVVVEPFDGPDKPWLPGHRGVDLQAGEGDELIAPADGVVSFSGTVAGKRVVSIRLSDGTVLTFEPAVTDLVVGTRVVRDEPFGMVAAGSDHCFGGCLHWGVRRGGSGYLDPQALAARRRIGLKPVE